MQLSGSYFLFNLLHDWYIVCNYKEMFKYWFYGHIVENHGQTVGNHPKYRPLNTSSHHFLIVIRSILHIFFLRETICLFDFQVTWKVNVTWKLRVDVTWKVNVKLRHNLTNFESFYSLYNDCHKHMSSLLNFCYENFDIFSTRYLYVITCLFFFYYQID